MDIEDDPTFWEWLIEQQKNDNKQKEAFQPLVLELPLPPPRPHETPEMGEILDESSNSDLDTHDENYVIYEF